MGGWRTGLGALATWGRGGGDREDSWQGQWEQDVVTQGVGWWQLMCSGQQGWGLAGPLILLLTPSHPGPAGCWLGTSGDLCARLTGPGGHQGWLLSAQNSSLFMAAQLQVSTVYPNLSPREPEVWPRWPVWRGQCEQRCRGERGWRCGHEVWLVRVGLPPATPVLQGPVPGPRPKYSSDSAWTSVTLGGD